MKLNDSITYEKSVDISFIIPVFNTDIKLLTKCIDCIASITSENCECVVIDDGSECEKSMEYEKLCFERSEVKYYRQSNMGVSGARNVGIKIATGKYIYFCDSDDQIMPEFFENFKIKGDYDIYFTKMIISMSNIKEEACKIDTKSCEVTKDELFDSLLLCGFLNGPYCKIIKRYFLLENDIEFDSVMKNGEDLVFLLNMIRQNPRMYYIDANSYIYYYDLDTRKNRVLSEPKRCLEDDTIVANEMIRMAREVGRTDIRVIENLMVKNRINTIFLDASNITAYDLDKWNIDVKRMYQQEMKKVDISKIEQWNVKLIIEYYTIRYGCWTILILISLVRKLYLKLKKNFPVYAKGDIK